MAVRATEALTFLFTDVEGSTRAWERDADSMDTWLTRHDRIVQQCVSRHGRVFKHTGDGVCAVFSSAADAIQAAHEIQTTLAAAEGPHIGVLRARIAVHTGLARERGGDFYGPTLNRCARLLAVGHGGQVLVSSAAAALLGDCAESAAGLTLLDLGRHRLRDLREPEHVWQLVAPDLEHDFAPLRSLDAFPQNLPIQRSSFVGLDAEREALRARLAGHRLVTVTGVGGCGKTRFALEVAAGVVDRFRDGVFFVDLSALQEPALVSSTIAAAVGAPASGVSSEERLATFLADRQMLLVLDNCEHLLDGCAAAVNHLQTRCAGVSVLATSREPLVVEGEHVWRVPSLRLPEGDTLDDIVRAEAVHLFADRAAAVRPGFAVTAENAAAVAEICVRLDGIPLALELAAARVAHLSPREIATRLSDRFRLLTTGRRGVPRQQSLQAVLDWSHELLSEAERVLLRRVAVFAGGWSMEAAQDVCAGEGIDAMQVVDLLGALVSRSLVDAEDRGDHTRYRVLETVRQYAQDRLVAAGEAIRERTAHARWCLQRAETSPDGDDGDIPQQRLWFSATSFLLAPDLDNMRQAADWWLAQGRVDLMARIVTATTNTFHTCGRFDEPEELLQVALARAAELPVPLLALCHSASALTAELRGEFFAANERAQRAIDLVDEPADAGSAYSLLVANLTWIDVEAAERLAADAPRWARPLGARADGYVSKVHGELAMARGDYDRAFELLTQAELRETPYASETALPSLFTLAILCIVRGDADAAAALLARLRPVTHISGWIEYYPILMQALIAAVRRDRAGVHRELRRAMALVHRFKLPLGLADGVLACAVAAFHGGEARRASELLASVAAATGGGLRSPMSMLLYRHYLFAVRAALDPPTRTAARAAGAALSLDAALERELAHLA